MTEQEKQAISDWKEWIIDANELISRDVAMELIIELESAFESLDERIVEIGGLKAQIERYKRKIHRLEIAYDPLEEENERLRRALVAVKARCSQDISIATKGIYEIAREALDKIQPN